MASVKDSPGAEVPAHRACAHCRSQKVRCIMDDTKPDVCQRCARTGRPCVFTPLQKRKQRKRTDTRVAELEREMRAMRSMLKNKEQRSGSQGPGPEEADPGPAQGLWYTENVPTGTQPIDGVATSRNTPGEAVLSRVTGVLPEDGKDIVDRGLVSMETARNLFDTYRRDLFPNYPMVHIPPSTSAEEMRSTRPTLFLAITAAAAAKGNSELSAALDQEVLQAYAMKSMVHSEKSLELVQALFISAVWYHPPSKFGQLKYYEYIHMSATMAMDIGIGSRPTSHHNRLGRASNRGQRKGIHHLEDATNPDLSMTPRSPESSPDTGSIECRRTFLACYIICAGVSVSLRRPNMLRATSYIKDCIECMERSPNAIPTDRTVVAWAKLLIIVDEISSSFCYDDPGGVASIVERSTQLMLRDFDKRLDAWYTNVPEPDTNGSLILMYYTARLYLHEIALHIEHSPEDFQAPYQMGVIHEWEGGEIPTQALSESIASCISSARGLIETFLSMEIEASRALPVFSYVRISFAAFVLAKLCLSAGHKRSRIGQVLDRSSLKMEILLDRAILHVRAVIGSTRARVPAIFLALLFKLRSWCMNPELIQNNPRDAEPRLFESSFRAAHFAPSPMSSDGARIAEQSSGGESSPPTTSDAPVGHVMGSLAMPPAASTAGSIPARLNPVDPNTATPSPGMPLANPEPAPISMGGMSVPMMAPYPNPDDPMDMDQDLLSYFGDMQGLADGGLTGFEDWGQIPTDIMGLPDNFNWQTAGADATAQL